MRDYTATMLEQLSNHISMFDIGKINDWLSQAAEQFSAEIQETEQDGLILQFKENEMHVGSEYFGDTREEKEINIFYNFINYHYGSVVDGDFSANLNYENDIRYPVFG